VLIPEKASDPEFIAAMQKLAPDVCVTAAYGQYLPKAFLDIPRCGTVNIHPSLLPKYRGAAPVQRCLDNGDTTAGVSVLFSVKKMDAGPVLGQESVELNGNENASDLLVALFDRGTKLLLKLMPNILSGCAGTTTQDDSQATLAPKCANVESEIHLESMSASMVHNRCRALHGSQGVWTMLRSEPKQILKEIDSKSESTNSSSIANTGTNSNSSGKTDKAQATARYAEGENIRVKLIETMVIKEDPADGSSVDISPGDVSRGLDVDRSVSIVKVNKQRVLRLTCGDGSKLGVVMLQPATKRVMSASDFMNGQVGRDIYWIPFESEAEPQTTSTTSAGIIEAKKTSQ
jgi:methionyl-tRNA formyltransferase